MDMFVIRRFIDVFVIHSVDHIFVTHRITGIIDSSYYWQTKPNLMQTQPNKNWTHPDKINSIRLILTQRNLTQPNPIDILVTPRYIHTLVTHNIIHFTVPVTHNSYYCACNS